VPGISAAAEAKIPGTTATTGAPGIWAAAEGKIPGATTATGVPGISAAAEEKNPGTTTAVARNFGYRGGKNSWHYCYRWSSRNFGCRCGKNSLHYSYRWSARNFGCRGGKNSSHYCHLWSARNFGCRRESERERAPAFNWEVWGRIAPTSRFHPDLEAPSLRPAPVANRNRPECRSQQASPKRNLWPQAVPSRLLSATGRLEASSPVSGLRVLSPPRFLTPPALVLTFPKKTFPYKRHVSLITCNVFKRNVFFVGHTR